MQAIRQDWHLSIGDASAAIFVKCKRTGNSYEAVIKYYILDYYDWETNATKGAALVSDGDMYKLHVAGDAREFRTIGLYETTLKWNQGQKLRLKSDKIYVS
ncbi:MAG: hypothetical protein J6Y71_00640 [Ruminococcus sp.]|nr:hypothetical protein [Ruminococcus sp.]